MTAASIDGYLGKELGYIHTRGDEMPSVAVKQVLVHTPATAVSGYTLAVDLTKYGITKVWAVRGINHTTANSVFVLEAPTTAVSGTTLTITVGGSASTKKRSYLIIGE